jgi:hypothetical protein
MSRRSRRAPGAPPAPPPVAEDRPGRPPQKLSLAAMIGILVATFAVTVGLAELFGAANLGVAFGIGQITFAIVLVILLVRA